MTVELERSGVQTSILHSLYLLHWNLCSVMPKNTERRLKVLYYVFCNSGLIWYHLSQRQQWTDKIRWSEFQETNKGFQTVTAMTFLF